jgi:hypothetical protein
MNKTHFKTAPSTEHQTVKSIFGSKGNISGRHLAPQVLYPYIFALEAQCNTTHNYTESILATQIN